jgi:gluconolactonase
MRIAGASSSGRGPMSRRFGRFLAQRIFMLSLLAPRPAVVFSLLALALTAHAAEPAATLAPIPGVIAEGTRVEFIKEGFQGTEGPIALPNGDLLFTETTASRILRITPAGEVSTFLSDTNGSNALALTPAGELISVQTAQPCVGVVHPADHAQRYAENFEGQPFFRPNDLVLDKKGGVYFTDPSGPAKAGQPAPPPPSVYYITPARKLLRLTTEVPRPNGIQLSPDEKILYLANTSGEFVFAYDIAADGTISHRREFAQLAGFRKTETGTTSGADGLAVDASGRLYVATIIGIQVFSATGEALGTIPLPKQPQNLAFAGPGKKTLYVVGRGAAYKIAVLTPGFAGRAK